MADSTVCAGDGADGGNSRSGPPLLVSGDSSESLSDSNEARDIRRRRTVAGNSTSPPDDGTERLSGSTPDGSRQGRRTEEELMAVKREKNRRNRQKRKQRRRESAAAGTPEAMADPPPPPAPSAKRDRGGNPRGPGVAAETPAARRCGSRGDPTPSSTSTPPSNIPPKKKSKKSTSGRGRGQREAEGQPTGRQPRGETSAVGGGPPVHPEDLTTTAQPSRRMDRVPFSEVVRSGIVLDVSAPECLGAVQLGEEDRAAIERGILDAVLREDIPEGVCPRFRAASLRSGVVRVVCDDRNSAEWARRVIGRLSPPGHATNGTYRVLAPWDRPPADRFTAMLTFGGPGGALSVANIERALRIQNPELAAPGVLRVESTVGPPTRDGAVVRLVILRSHRRLLEQNRYCLAWAARRVSLRRGREEEPAGKVVPKPKKD